MVDLRLRNLCADGIEASAADVVGCVLVDVSFAHASLERSRWIDTMAREATFDGAVVCSASFNRCDFSGASMSALKGENVYFEETRLDNCDMQGLMGRHSMFRDCSMKESNLSGSYLYRASFTGDPMQSMDMRGSMLRGANLVQAYVAADLSSSDLSNAYCAYARFNQSLLVGASLRGANIFQASCVKTKFDGADLAGVQFTAFADRCTGLEEALAATGDASENLDFLRKLVGVLADRNHRST